MPKHFTLTLVHEDSISDTPYLSFGYADERAFMHMDFVSKDKAMATFASWKNNRLTYRYCVWDGKEYVEVARVEGV